MGKATRKKGTRRVEKRMEEAIRQNGGEDAGSDAESQQELAKKQQELADKALADLVEDQKRLLWLVTKGAWLAKKGPPDNQLYYIALRSQIRTRGFKDWREAIDSQRLK